MSEQSVNHHCRLEQECIMYIGRNRSGIDSGEIDYGIYTDKFDRMSAHCLKNALRSLSVLEGRVKERIAELEAKAAELYEAREKILVDALENLVGAHMRNNNGEDRYFGPLVKDARAALEKVGVK